MGRTAKTEEELGDEEGKQQPGSPAEGPGLKGALLSLLCPAVRASDGPGGDGAIVAASPRRGTGWRPERLVRNRQFYYENTRWLYRPRCSEIRLAVLNLRQNRSV